MIKGIIFDLDGTLLNTIEDINNALNTILKKYNMPLKTVEESKLNLGSGSINLVKRSLPENIDTNTFDKIHTDYQVQYKNNNNILTRPYDGIIEVLKELKNQGYRLAVVSNKDDGDVKVLNQEKFLGLIEVAIGARPNKPVKPDPYLLNIALDKLGLLSSEVIYVGDSDVDILTAKHANLKMITVSWGFRPYQILLEYQAENIVNEPIEILSKVNEIND